MLRLENQIQEMPSMTAVDPLGVMASLINLVTISARTVKLLLTLSEVSSPDILEYKVYCQILSQVGEQSLSISGKLPNTAARAGLTLCHVRTTQVVTSLSENMILSKKGQSLPQDVKRAIKDYGRSVKILRDIIMEYAAIHT